MTPEEILNRIEEIENQKIPHCAQMYNNGMINNDRGRTKFWMKARARYGRELEKLYTRLEILTQ